MRVPVRRFMGGAFICALVVASAGVVWWRLGATEGPGAAPPVAREQLRYFEMPTSTWEVGTAGKQAGLSGTLRFAADGCPYVDMGGHRVWVVMPAGARGVSVDGERSIVDPTDLVYGTEGDEVFWGGGYQPGETSDCAPSDEGSFSVQIAPQTRRIDGTTVDPEPPTAHLGDPPCQKPDDPPDDVDYFDASAVARKFDYGLRTYTSYAGTVWHAGGGMRVRIATNHTDTDAARAEAERIIATLPATYRHAVKISETTVSLDDLRAWEEDAEDGLTYLPAKDNIGASADERCLSVNVWVKAHSAVRLTDQESARYQLRGFQLVAQP